MAGVRSAHLPEPPAVDLPARVLNLGLGALVILLPLPFGAVGPWSRLGLEVGALILGCLWLFRGFFYRNRLPPRAVRVGGAGLLLLASLQFAPLGSDLVSFLSPASIDLRNSSQPDAAALEAETRLLGRTPRELDSEPSLSVDPARTASAVRTGAALFTLLLISTTVTTLVGGRSLGRALLISAAFQGLYGLTVLISGYDQIWHLAKPNYLYAATGTFVNPNHYSSFLAMSLTCGLGLILANARTMESNTSRHPLLRVFGTEGSRNLILIVLLAIGLAGLMASFSRAGIAIGLTACGATLIAARGTGLRLRLVVAALVFCAAAVPLGQIGSDRLFHRYNEIASAISGPGARGTVWHDTLAMVADYPIVGTGFGTFSAVYPAYRDPSVRRFYPHAHNDLLQAIAEGGLLGTVFLALLLAPLAAVVSRSLTGAKGLLAIGFAAGISTILLHSLVDFPFHIPANAATAAILAGALFGLQWHSRT